MNIKNIITCASLVAAVATSAILAAWGAEYTVVSEWNSVSSVAYADGTNDLTAARGWTCPTNGAQVSGGVIVIDMESSTDKLVYTPTAPIATNRFETAYVDFKNVEAYGISDLDNTAQAGLAAAVGTGNATNWYGWCADGWTKLTNVTPGTGPCIVRVEFNNSNDTQLVRYAVKQGTDDFVVLTADETEWLTNGVANVQRVNDVLFDGRSAFTNITFTQTGTMTVADESKFAGRKKEQGIADADLNKIANNGNANWENLVLGLEGTNVTSKPVVQPVQSTETDSVTLKLGGVDVDKESATVKYTVVESATPSGVGTETAAVNYDTSTSVPLPSSGVKYYRMKVQAMPK